MKETGDSETFIMLKALHISVLRPYEALHISPLRGGGGGASSSHNRRWQPASTLDVADDNYTTTVVIAVELLPDSIAGLPMGA